MLFGTPNSIVFVCIYIAQEGFGFNKVFEESGRILFFKYAFKLSMIETYISKALVYTFSY